MGNNSFDTLVTTNKQVPFTKASLTEPSFGADSPRPRVRLFFRMRLKMGLLVRQEVREPLLMVGRRRRGGVKSTRINIELFENFMVFFMF